ncbi:MAG: hypothetical protein N2440_02780 [Actinobacteria bacterium]|nr:hypothetical protein [Actinomycetota bacterium]
MPFWKNSSISKIQTSIINLIFVFMDFSLLASAGFYYLLNELRIPRYIKSPYILGFVLLSLADILYSYQELSSSYVTGKGLSIISDISWMLSYFLLANYLIQISTFRTPDLAPIDESYTRKN